MTHADVISGSDILLLSRREGPYRRTVRSSPTRSEGRFGLFSDADVPERTDERCECVHNAARRGGMLVHGRVTGCGSGVPLLQGRSNGLSFALRNGVW